jgi:hypothetical protein
MAIPLTKMYIKEGGVIPFGYAIAYQDFYRDVKVAYPIPIHFIVRWLRDLRFWLMSVGRPGYRERIEQELFQKFHNEILYPIIEERMEKEQKARDVGFAEGYVRAMKNMEQELRDKKV